MNTDGGRQSFAITIDNSQLRTGANESKRILHSVGTQATQEGERIDSSMRKIGTAMAGAFAIDRLKDFGMQIAKVRGEFQQLEIAFETMLGSKAKADALMAQLIHTAATTPFQMSDVANSAKQLLAYGLEADKVNETLIRLGDIAAGLSIPINDLAYLYGTTMVQGRLYTQDLNQFLGRGIPLSEELAKQFNVTTSEVKQLVEEGKIGFPEVEKAIVALTDEGSKFGGLMEAQSHTITGQISNIEDAIEQMFNEIGKSSEGAIQSGLGVVSKLIDNWQTIGKVLMTVITAYGTYKAAVIAVNALTAIRNRLLAEAALQMKLASMEGIALSQAEAIASAGMASMSGALNALKAAFASNPIGLLLTAVSTAAVAFGLFSKDTSKATQMTEKFGESASSAIMRVETLTTTLNGLTDGTSTHKKVVGELNEILEEYGLQAIKEGDSIDSVNRKREQAIQLIKEEGIERQRANALEQGAANYDQAVKDAQEQLYKDLANAKTGAQFLGASWGWDNDEIRDNAAAISTIIADVVGNNIELIAGKTGEKYDQGIQQIYATIQERMRAIGISEDTIAKAWMDGGFLWTENLVDKYIGAMKDAKEEHNSYTAAIEANTSAERAAADASMTWAQKVSALESKLKGPNDSVKDLYNNIKTLMSQYSDNTIGFHIDINGEPPAWLQDMDIDELKRLATKFSSLGANSPFGVSVDGKFYTQQQALQTGMHAANVLKQKQGEEEKRKAEEKAKAEERKREAKRKAQEARRKREQAQRERKRKEEEERRERERIAEQTASRNQAIKKYADSVKEQYDQSELDLRQRKIELLEDSADKELAQINLNYDRLIAENKRREKEMLEALADNKLNEWLNEHPKATNLEQIEYRKSLLDENSEDRLSIADLTEGQQAQLLAYQEQADKALAHGKKELYKKLLSEYQSYETRRKETAEKFDKERKAIEDAPIDTTQKEEAITELEKKRKEAIQAIYNEEAEAVQKSSSLLVELFGDASEKSDNEIRKIITSTQDLLSYLASTDKIDITPKFGFNKEDLIALKESPEKIKAIREQLKQLIDASNRSNPFKSLIINIKKLWKKPKEGEGKLSIEAKLKRIGESASESARVVGDLAGRLADMFEASGSDELAEAFEGVQQAMTSVSNIAQGFAQGGIFGGIMAGVGEAVGLITKGFQAQARHAQAINEVMKQLTAQQRAYNLALLEQNLALKEANTIFGTLDYNKAVNAVAVLKDAYNALSKEIKGTAEQQNKQKQIGWFENFIGKTFNQSKVDSAGLADIEIKTGHKKTGLFGWGKGKDLYSSILDIYPELIDKAGKFNVELAKSIINSRDFKGEGKEALQYMIDLAEQSEKAFEEVKNYLTGIFGELGNTLSNALVDAFRNGTDASKAFGDSVTSMLEKIGEQMIFSTMFSSIIQQANDKMLEVMKNQSKTEEQKFNDYISILEGMTTGILGQQDNFNALMKRFKEMAGEKGVNLWDSKANTQEGSKRGFATASQDSIDELNGRFTASVEILQAISTSNDGLTSNTTDILRLASERNAILTDTLTQIAMLKSDIEVLKKGAQEVMEFNGKFDKMNKQLERL